MVAKTDLCSVEQLGIPRWSLRYTCSNSPSTQLGENRLCKCIQSLFFGYLGLVYVRKLERVSYVCVIRSGFRLRNTIKGLFCWCDAFMRESDVCEMTSNESSKCLPHCFLLYFVTYKPSKVVGKEKMIDFARKTYTSVNQLIKR